MCVYMSVCVYTHTFPSRWLMATTPFSIEDFLFLEIWNIAICILACICGFVSISLLLSQNSILKITIVLSFALVYVRASGYMYLLLLDKIFMPIFARFSLLDEFEKLLTKFYTLFINIMCLLRISFMLFIKVMHKFTGIIFWVFHSFCYYYYCNLFVPLHFLTDYC